DGDYVPRLAQDEEGVPGLGGRRGVGAAPEADRARLDAGGGVSGPPADGAAGVGCGGVGALPPAAPGGLLPGGAEPWEEWSGVPWSSRMADFPDAKSWLGLPALAFPCAFSGALVFATPWVCCPC